MRRLLRTIQLFLRSNLTWRAARQQAKPVGPYRTVAGKDGELYVQPTPAPVLVGSSGRPTYLKSEHLERRFTVVQ